MQFNANAFEALADQTCQVQERSKELQRLLPLCFWYKMTGNGMREGDWKTWRSDRDGEYVEIKATPSQGWIRMELRGDRVEMLVLQGEAVPVAEVDKTEVNVKSSALTQEITRMYNDRFRACSDVPVLTFSLDYHSFFDPEDNNSSMRRLVFRRRQNMMALLARDTIDLGSTT